MNRIRRSSSAVGGSLRLVKALSTALIVLTALTGANSMTHAQTANIIYSFPGNGSGDGGARPDAELLLDASGNLYGTTSSGGNNRSNGGIAFELSPSGSGGWSENVLFQFLEPLGDEATSALVADGRGNLYGTTPAGGAYRDGVVFQLAPKANGVYQYRVLYSFTGGSDGSTPFSGVIVDKAGNLYGTTNLGGANFYGTIFEFARQPNGSYVFSVLHDFAGAPSDGITPVGLIFDKFGNIFGATNNGGAGTNGTVFELAKGTNGVWAYSILYSFEFNFTGASGGGPEAPPQFDKVGNLYGTTVSGGSCSWSTYGCGIVYKLKRSSGTTWTESVLYTFQGGSDGAFPQSQVAFDSAGNLYGTTSNGGGGSDCSYGCGTVFKVSYSAGVWRNTQLYAFQGQSSGDGSDPTAGLVIDSLNNLYGTTYAGGLYGYGTVFEVTP
jgi:uncharacterized repeat protein (TIGR03803 family)